MHYLYDISFITINYNGVVDTCEMIASLQKVIKSVTYEVIVTDNASKEDEATLIEQRFPEVKVVRSKVNLGFAGGNNIAIPYAQGRYLMFINNDTFVEEDHFDALIKRLENGICDSTEEIASACAKLSSTSSLKLKRDGKEENERVGVVCPKLRFAWGKRPIQWAGFTPLTRVTLRNKGIGCNEIDEGQYDTPHATSFAHGAAMMVSREALKEVGLMWEGYFLYYEEMDWSECFTRAHYKIMYEPACTVYHKESQTVGDGGPAKVYYLTRNRLLFAKRNRRGVERVLCYAYLTTIALFLHAPLFFVKGKFSQFKSILMGVFDFWLGKCGSKFLRLK